MDIDVITNNRLDTFNNVFDVFVDETNNDIVFYYFDGALHSGSIRFDETLVGKTITLTEPIPPLATGDQIFGYVIIDGSALSGDTPGIRIDNAERVSISGITLANFKGDGIVIGSLTPNTSVTATEIQRINVVAPGRHGLVIQGVAKENFISGISIDSAGSHGIKLSGPNVLNNEIRNTGTLNGVELFPTSVLNTKDGYGIILDRGASRNLVQPGLIEKNKHGGILLTGATTQNNIIGYREDDLLSFTQPNRINSNGVTADIQRGDGILIEKGAHNNTVRLVSTSGNTRNGVTIKDENTHSNRIFGLMTGNSSGSLDAINILPNEGSGLVIRSGASSNIVGRLDGERFAPGTIGSRDDNNYFISNKNNAVVISGEGTENNIISQSRIGSKSLFQSQGADNGEGGIHLDAGARKNQIGGLSTFAGNIVFSGNKYGLQVSTNATDNLIFGNSFES